jgi:hypothetical protein
MIGHAQKFINHLARQLICTGMLVLFLPFGVLVGIGKTVQLLASVKDAI